MFTWLIYLFSVYKWRIFYFCVDFRSFCFLLLKFLSVSLVFDVLEIPFYFMKNGEIVKLWCIIFAEISQSDCFRVWFPFWLINVEVNFFLNVSDVFWFWFFPFLVVSCLWNYSGSQLFLLNILLFFGGRGEGDGLFGPVEMEMAYFDFF